MKTEKPTTDPSLNKNFELEIGKFQEKIEWINPSIWSKIRRFLGRNSDAILFSYSDRANKFFSENHSLGMQASTLELGGFSIEQNIERSVIKNFLILNVKDSFSPTFVQLMSNHIFLFLPNSLRFFINIKWVEYLAQIESNEPEKEFFNDLAVVLLDIAYCHARATNAYYEYCKSLLYLSDKRMEKGNLVFMTKYLECMNHSEMCLLLDKAILDKLINAYAFIFKVSINGKGQTHKKIDKISREVTPDMPFSNHWSAFTKVVSSEQYQNLNNYRTGLVHKICPSDTAFHKKFHSGIMDGFHSSEKLMKESNNMCFFAFSSLIFLLDEKYLLKIKN